VVVHAISYVRHRFPPRIIGHAVWLYLRFTLSYRDVEDLLAARGLDVVRRWVLEFGPAVAQKLRHARPKPDGRWHLDAGPMPMHERLGTNDRKHLQDRWTPSIVAREQRLSD
jgi:transposase-like protein